jgi:hypothetical protein
MLIMASSLTKQGEYLVEYLGPLEMLFLASERNGELHYSFYKCRCFGISIPNKLSPKIVASERQQNGKYNFSVKVYMFLLGMVISYSGTLQLNDD